MLKVVILQTFVLKAAASIGTSTEVNPALVESTNRLLHRRVMKATAGHDIHVTNQNLVVFQPTGQIRHKNGTVSGGHQGTGANMHLPIWVKDGVEYVTFDGGENWTAVADVATSLNTSIARETVTR